MCLAGASSAVVGQTGWFGSFARTRPVGPVVRSFYYLSDVAPVVDRLGCATSRCHGGTGGKGGLKLSLFGADPTADCEAIARGDGGRRITATNPPKSLLLQKVTGIPACGADKPRIAAGSADYKIVLAWITQGARASSPDIPVLVSVEATPRETIEVPGHARQLRLTAIFSDKSRRDVTRDARWQATEPAIADVSAAGLVSVKATGQGYVVASYLRHAAVVRVLAPQKLPFLFPAVKPANGIDGICLAQLKRLGIPPSPLCTDSAFIRRLFLDVIGRLPTPDEARAFLADKRPDRRARLIDDLLARDEFADFWALKWGDLLRLKSEYPVNLWPKAVQAYHRWIRDSIKENKPYDQFATELLVSQGSNFRSGPANYYRAVTDRDPVTFAETTGLLFMGARLGCARCHGHPIESWTHADVQGMAAFFAGVRFKATQEWKEEVVYRDPEAVFPDPVTHKPVAPTFLDGTVPVPAAGEDPRRQFAHWLTSPKNPWFARTYANRLWFWLLGRGLVNEPDDMRPSNPPANPALLDFLAKEFTSHGYDTRYLYRLILNSRTYQLSSTPTKWNQADVAQFSHHPAKRLSAEEMLDAVCQVTESPDTFYNWAPAPYTRLPAGTSAVQVVDASISTPFLDTFGRPARDSAYESERCSRESLRQVMLLLNSGQIENKIANGKRVGHLQKAGKNDAEIADELYLAALSRFPMVPEKEAVVRHLTRDPKLYAQSIQDVLWALLNLKEFSTIR